MKRVRVCALTVLVALSWAGLARSQGEEAGSEAKTVYDFEVKNIDGKEVKLSDYKGDVVLMVNVASRCGLTPQYKDLQKLHDKYKDSGLRVLGFPANNFGGQEPGSNEEIKSFCSSNYNVTFDMFAKVSVKGSDCCPLYQFLTAEETNGEFAGEIEWNFTKFLIDGDGKVIARFGPKVKPMSKRVRTAIDKALEDKS